MDEYCELDFRMVLLKIENGLCKTSDRYQVVVLRVKNPDHRTSATEDAVCVIAWVKIVDLTRQIPNLEIRIRSDGALAKDLMAMVVLPHDLSLNRGCGLDEYCV